MQGLFFNPPIVKQCVANILQEIYLDGIYYPYLLGKENLTIIDAGANIGLTSYFFSQFSKIVYAIEPSKDHLEVLRYMIDFNKLTNIKVCPFALSIKEGTETFYHYSNATMYSLYPNILSLPTASKNLEQTGEEEVNLKRLDTFFEEEKIDHVDFLKLDIEGSEFEVLGSDSFRKVAPKIDKILMEVHPYSGRNIVQVIQSLQVNGFTVDKILNNALLYIAQK